MKPTIPDPFCSDGIGRQDETATSAGSSELVIAELVPIEATLVGDPPVKIVSPMPASSLTTSASPVAASSQPLLAFPVETWREEEHAIVAELISSETSERLEDRLVPATNAETEHGENFAAAPKPYWMQMGWWLRLPGRIVYGLFQFASLILLLAIASSIPLLQFASLGYMLEVGRRIAAPKKGQHVLPGLAQATRIGVIAAGAFLTWLPVWLVSDYAYNAELIEAGGLISRRWHTAAWIVTLLWLAHISWAALRGGRWYHFLWPAPLKFALNVWRPSTWQKVEDGLWQYTVGLKLPMLTWLGFRGAIGAIAWLIIPAAMMTIGIRANDQPARVLIGVLGIPLMTLVLMYLPFLQLQMARENRFRAIFDVRSVRADFKRAPWAFTIAFFFTFALALPLYLFRIESLPKELLWLPCLFFVLMTLPARMLVGWALRRGHRDIKRRFWLSRYLAWSIQLVSIPFYILALYLGTITSWDGVAIFLVQHAFLVPVPFAGT